MSDLISRQAAIEIVEEYTKAHTRLTGVPISGAACIVADLEDLPPAEPERKQGEWIPCSETLPKSWGKYLTTVKFHSQNLIEFLYYTDNLEKVDEFKFKGETRPAWYRYDTEYGHLETLGVVTAWMPLPKAYEE